MAECLAEVRPVTVTGRAVGVLEQILASLPLSIQFLTNVSVVIC